MTLDRKLLVLTLALSLVNGWLWLTGLVLALLASRVNHVA
jgi:hypothetical protein